MRYYKINERPHKIDTLILAVGAVLIVVATYLLLNSLILYAYNLSEPVSRWLP